MKVFHPFKNNVLPGPQQALLLKACLIEDSATAKKALIQWQEFADLDSLDHGSFRLVPLLWKRARREEWDLSEDEGRLRGLYRYTWSKHQLLEREAESILATFAEANIPTILLKGVAISRLVYDDPVCRPYSDIDVLVSADRMRESVELLQSKEWTTLQTGMDSALNELHAIGFQSPGKIELDLHQHVLQSNASAEVTEEIYSRAQPIEWRDLSALTLSFEDHFIHVCAHGAVFSPWSQIRWLADANRILIHCGSNFDWDVVQDSASRFGCLLSVQETVNWLVQEVGQNVPDEVLNDLNRRPLAASDRVLTFISSVKIPKVSKLRHRLSIDFVHYLRRSPFRLSGDWFSGLKKYLISVNNFDRSFPSLFRSWYYLGVLKIRNIQFGYLPFLLSKKGNRTIHRDSISRWRESEMFGFHLLECDVEKRLLRWSDSAAGLHLRDFQDDFILELHTLNCRPGLVDTAEIKFVINGLALPPDFVRMGEGGIISIQIKRPYRPEIGDAWITWKIEPWELVPGDTRELGVPVYAIRKTLKKPNPASRHEN